MISIWLLKQNFFDLTIENDDFEKQKVEIDQMMHLRKWARWFRN